uniref:Myb/SANT-like DNA-binding domain-containing protein n=1 Tax=Chara braunii TaxID=69332 RepID=A0A388KMP4_CHABU
MADVFRRLPLLLLVVLLLLLLVVFHVCILGGLPRRGRRRRCVKNNDRMEGQKAISGSAGECGGRWSGNSPSNSPRPSEQSGHAHLPPHLQPLPDTDDEEGDDRRSLTVPLGSGSTQEWVATELFGSRDGGKGQSYTELLQQGISDTDGDGGVNLSFGLGSGRSAVVSRTVVVNPHPHDDGSDVTAVQRSPRSPAPLREASGNNNDPPRQQFRSPSVCRGRRVGECRETAPAVADVGDARDGREVWAEQRQLMRSVREESITRGVQRLRVGEDGHDGEDAGADAHDPDWNDNGAEGWEDDAANISPSKQAAAMGGRGGKTKSCSGNGRRGKRTAGKGSDAEGDVDGEGGRHFWSVDDIIALIRAKRDQDAHLQGMGHVYARMKPREWKWLNVATRLKKVGVDREADRCGKKWDNLMQQFKKVHHFQGLSGKQDFFQLSGKDRMSKGLKHDDDDDGSTKGSSQTTGGTGGFGKRKSTRQQTFEAMTECMEKHGALMASTMESNSKRHCSIAIRQCEALEAEIEVQKKHYAASDEILAFVVQIVIVTAGASCAMSSRASTRGKAAANLSQQPATREKKGRHMASKKRKILEGAPAHGGYVLDEEWVPKDVATQEGTDFEDSDDMPLQRKSSRRGSGGIRIDDAGERRRAGGRPVPEDVVDVDAATTAKEGGGNRAPLPRMTPPTDTQEGVVCLRTPLTPRSRTAADVALSGGPSQAAGGVRAGGAAGYAAKGGESNAGEGATAGVKASDVAGEGDDDDPSVNRLRQQNTREMEAAAKLWVDDLRFWNEREGFAIVKLIAEARGYLVVVARGEQPPPIRRSIVLPHNSIPQHKITDESELNVAKERALKVQGIALRVIHGWVFKSQNMQRGYHAAYQYALNHAATDIARAMWMGEDWRYCVSPMVIHHTLDMHMKLPLWFVGADVEDRHEDDGLAAYQEASIQRLVGDFTSAVIIAEATDGDRVSHERLKTMADAMRMMLAATMWLMRMAGDDHRAHYNAWVFVQLTAKPTLVASMHRCFDARRHIVQAVTVITDKLASPPITLIDPPMYVPDWASIGVKFSHDATLSSPMEAKKVDWLGTGPPEDEDDGKGDEQGSGGGR